VLGCNCNHHMTSCSTSHRWSIASHQDIAPYNDQADVTCPHVDSVSPCLSQPSKTPVTDAVSFIHHRRRDAISHEPSRHRLHSADTITYAPRTTTKFGGRAFCVSTLCLNRFEVSNSIRANSVKQSFICSARQSLNTFCRRRRTMEDH